MDGRRHFLSGSQPISSQAQRMDRVGFASAIAAYASWGFMPVFFKLLQAVPAMEIIAHRIIWAVPLLIVIMAMRQQLSEYRNALACWSMLRWMLGSAVLISVNWMIYVWAINTDQIVAASFGYYLNPLMNIMIGTIFLKERMSHTQFVAVAVAAVGVLVMGAATLGTLWISLSLGATFCAYGLVRKMAPVGAVPGLGIETTLLLPIAMAGAFWFAQQGPHPGWGSDIAYPL
jgi:chloramphenicol-sensitive protein RarD